MSATHFEMYQKQPELLNEQKDRQIGDKVSIVKC